MTRPPRGPIDRLMMLFKRAGMGPSRFHGRGSATCPSCDEIAVLHFRVDDDGRVALRCFAGCPYETVAERLRELAECDIVPVVDQLDLGDIVEEEVRS